MQSIDVNHSHKTKWAECGILFSLAEYKARRAKMKAQRFWSILLIAFFIVGCLLSCTPQSFQEQASNATETPLATPVVTKQPSTSKTTVWRGLTFIVTHTQWVGNTATLEISVENRGSDPAKFTWVFYAYGEDGSCTRMCQSNLKLWATYAVGDSKYDTVYFNVPPSSGSLWLAIEVTKIIEIPRVEVPQVLETKEVGGYFSFTLNSIEWTGNRAAIDLTIKNIDKYNYPLNCKDITLGSWSPTSLSWCSGNYIAGEAKAGVLYFDVPQCSTGLYLSYEGIKLFPIYR